ncbi:glycosyltransferase [Microbacter margulisiae]|uniref:Glycosyltransferase involved in cell wall biosynthesis n=1 Tax=Microbacter margulisiae TaxID=1350067 RepID=A0A7W5DN50_9PORP|nr:glycosyltransferase [Microbacter margulisiae]MBB3185984.1 glycosyltransferase involved in cell wall biosynthesis [Microbacter margulisiae]
MNVKSLTDSKKTICCVIPSLHAGGMERVMSELVNYLSGKDYLKCYLINLSNKENFYKLNKNVKEIRPEFYNNNKFLYTLKSLLYLRNSLKRTKPYAVLSFGETYNTFTLIAAFGLGLNIFVSDRSKPDKDWGLVQNNLRKIFYPKAKGIIAQTTYAKKFIEKEIGHKNIRVIPNPIDLSKFNSEGKITERKNIVITVGRLIHSKRIDILIDAFSKTNNHQWKLCIVGDGPVRKLLEKQAFALGMIDDVVFLGNKSEIHEMYAQAKIFAFTSYSEGFPNAILEAMASGLPAIAFNCIAGPADLIDNGKNGFLVDLGDTNTFCEKLIELMNNETMIEQFSGIAKNKAFNYEMNKIGDEYLNFLLS